MQSRILTFFTLLLLFSCSQRITIEATKTSMIQTSNLPVVAWTLSSQGVNESVGTVTLTAELSKISDDDIQINFSVNPNSTATNGSDYSLNPASSLTIPSGSTMGTETITINNDVLNEPLETIIIDMQSPTNATLGTNSAFTLSINLSDIALLIYRSVGPGNTAPLASGSSNTLFIAGSVATFAATLSDTIGVGDVIQYDSDNNGNIDSIAFIHERLAANTFILAQADGTDATPIIGSDLDWRIYRAYTSLQNAEDGNENTGIASGVTCDTTCANLRDFDGWVGGADLVTQNQQWNIACYGDAVDAYPGLDYVVIQDWITGPNNYLKIYTPFAASEVGVSQRHRGIWNTSYYTLQGSHDFHGVIEAYVDYLRIEGLQIETTALQTVGSMAKGIDFLVGTEVYASSNLIRNTGGGTGGWGNSGISIYTLNPSANAYVWNNIIMSFGSGVLYDYGAAIDGAVYNNTIVNSGDIGLFIRGSVGNNRLHVKNNLVTGSANTDIYFINLASDLNNLSGDATATDPTLQNQTVTFVNAGASDYRIHTSDTGAAGKGVDLSGDPILSFFEDIQNQTRSATWSIGASVPSP